MSFDQQKIIRAFNDAVIETFAEMAFIDVVPEPHREGKISYTGIMGLEFSRPGRGHILFYMTKDCKKELVENIYGEEWIRLSDMEIDDCLLEILNVLAGDFLKNLFGEKDKVVMSFPRLYFDEENIPGNPGQFRFVYNAEGALFFARLSLEN
ncbi:chemotaxis protein CheX [Spirochaeta isovalerica]|uniref:CheY-specific phosphatase CheX n=1 Tax=Spirochaeta isovalerica TaxID=150 RepID=A0A841REQ2_9SPIO|nr:chemotaxis protein CheX [Spirochaeta isovalerica]MBB6481480.1 CheY-specific phosphatase CheX [Spirochaeta isovalerica]